MTTKRLSQETLLAVEQNSIELKCLHIGVGNMTHSRGEKFDDGEFHSSNSDDYDRLGTAIGNNTQLTQLMIDNLYNKIILDVINERFYDGIRNNSSITELLLHSIRPRSGGRIRYNSIADVALEALRACQEKNILTKLHINTMQLVSSAEENRFVESLRGFTNLREITYIHSELTDDQLLLMVEAIRGYALIENLELFSNRIGNAGCEALATLRNVTKVNFTHNNIGNEGMIAIANSLSENNHLRDLIVSSNPLDVRAVTDYFSRALCNAASINDIYTSNHTLESIKCHGLFGGSVTSLLEMNKKTNKRHVAIEKILLYHPPIDIEPLFDLSLEEGDSGQDLKALPHVISWFETAAEAIIDDNKLSANDLEIKKISAIYQFVTAMPMLFIPASLALDNGIDKKRKRSSD